MAAFFAAPVLCNGRPLSCRSRPVTAAALTAVRFLFVPSELPPTWVPVLHVTCFLLPILNYLAANCSCAAAPSYVGVEFPAALFHFSAQPKPSAFDWLFITDILLFINGELGQFALHHQHDVWLPWFFFPFRSSLQ